MRGSSRRTRGVLVPLVLLLATVTAPIAAHADSGATALILTLDPADEGPLGVPGATRLQHLPFAILRDPGLDAPTLLAHPAVLRVDPVEPLELHLDRVHALVRGPRAPGGPDLPVTGAGVGLAIVDSGLDTTHPDLADRIRANLRLTAAGFTPTATDATGHGTHVAGIAAGSGEASGGQHVGLAPDAHLVGLDITGAFDTGAALQAFDWILAHHEEHDVHIVVNAWGRKGPSRGYDAEDPLHVATDRLVDAGLVVLYSAGNRGPTPSSLTPEAQHPRALTVGALDDAAQPAPYSGRGPVLTSTGTPWVKPDVVAPGDRVASARAATTPTTDGAGDAYRELSGTSQATPAVAGVIALLLEAQPNLTPEDVGRILRQSALDLGTPGPDPTHGWGLVDTPRALDLAADRTPDATHVLLAGGVDRHRHEGRLLAGGDRALHLTDTHVATSTLTHRIPVLPGATRLDVTLHWTGNANYTLTLHHDLTTHAAPAAQTRPDGTREIRLTLHDPEPGIWQAQATGDALGDIQYALDAHTTVDPHTQANTDPESRSSPSAPATTRAAHLIPTPSTQLALEAGLLLALAVTATARRNR